MFYHMTYQSVLPIILENKPTNLWLENKLKLLKNTQGYYLLRNYN